MLDQITGHRLAVNQFNTAKQNFICRSTLNNSVIFGYNTYTGIFCCFMLHARSYEWSFRNKKRNSLTLHVRSHKRTVGVIVLKERNESRRNRYNLFRGYVHVVNPITRHRQDVI
ncbi:hypothetical protein D3C78_1168710 [compost metagenome]